MKYVFFSYFFKILTFKDSKTKSKVEKTFNKSMYYSLDRELIVNSYVIFV